MSQNTELFAELGEMLYGPQWQSPLARALGINLRTVQRWATGESTPPETVMDEVIKMFLAHAEHVAALAEQVRPSTTPESGARTSD